MRAHLVGGWRASATPRCSRRARTSRAGSSAPLSLWALAVRRDGRLVTRLGRGVELRPAKSRDARLASPASLRTLGFTNLREVARPRGRPIERPRGRRISLTNKRDFPHEALDACAQSGYHLK